jgi:hypothetical protein
MLANQPLARQSFKGGKMRVATTSWKNRFCRQTDQKRAYEGCCICYGYHGTCVCPSSSWSIAARTLKRLPGYTLWRSLSLNWHPCQINVHMYQGSMLWSQFSAIFNNFLRKNWRFSQKPMLWSFFSKFGFILSQKRQFIA